MADVDCRLAVYGTLAPGRANHHELADLRGTWRGGIVRGRLVQKGWGADFGYPALILDPAGDAVPVHLLDSADLPAHWARLDDFEGDGYARVVASIETDTGATTAWIYVSAD
ncbi:gamma-glutamylcyclotransferase [Sphingomonas crocodyli]|uniref:Gamma-glutamylcyclotransferase n=1 Tax=Sphingomonas crocodyli TaxID=1979270 RepID=A0A437MBP8_9SPHN|nr:gamma-glutamylcyclotransferase [Sphingomonas crocodyli]